MELYEELMRTHISVELSERGAAKLGSELRGIILTECFEALSKIRRIIRDDTMNDSECFMKIEHIVCVLERLGCDCGNRHDFG